ncbi:MAG: hypothetical protein ACO1SX_20285 [Actinomycetota bacterium]
MLTRFTSGMLKHIPAPLTSTLRVLLDGEHIADLDWLYDAQPVHHYRLTLLTEDRSKVEYALDRAARRDDDLRVLLQNSDSGGLQAETFHISYISWEEHTVRMCGYGSFHPPPRQALPDDEVAGFGTWAEAQRLVREGIEEELRYLKQYESERSAIAQRSLPRPALPEDQALHNLPTPSDSEDQPD